MFSLRDLQGAIQAGNIYVTAHAASEMDADHVEPQDVLFSLSAPGRPEAIEEYPHPQGRPYPMMLVLGWLPSGEPLHSLWAYDEQRHLAILVTVYRPDPSRWVDFRTRKTK